jgi:hypothetical protein
MGHRLSIEQVTGPEKVSKALRAGGVVRIPYHGLFQREWVRKCVIAAGTIQSKSNIHAHQNRGLYPKLVKIL